MRLTVLLIAFTAVAIPVGAQQARGLFLSVHGSEAQRSLGDPSSLQAVYIDIPATTRGPVHIRIFDAETGGYLDSRRGAFNTRTLFVVLGGSSAGRTHGIDSDPARNRRLTFPASDVLFDESVGQNPRYDRRYWALPALPIDKGLPVADGMRRFVLLAVGLEGDDANHFDFVVSTDPNDKIEPAGLSMFTYALTLRTPETPSFLGEVRIPTTGHESVRIETFGTGPAPVQAAIPFSDPIALQPAVSGSWSRQTLALPRNTASIGIQFNGHDRAHTFSMVARQPDGQPIPYPCRSVISSRFSCRAIRSGQTIPSARAS